MSKKYVSGTKEWASHSVNIQQNCEHDCLYCYAKTNAIRFGKATVTSWGTPVINWKAVNQKRNKLNGTIMFPTAHDISPLNIEACIAVLLKLLEAGNKVLIVSKPHLECVEALCTALTAYKKQILFRFTIGSANDAVLSFWEPHAPGFMERCHSLAYAFGQSFETSVSCEPMLDNNIEAVIEEIYPCVTDAIWIGKPNKLLLRTQMNGADENILLAAKQWLSIYTDEFIWQLYNKYQGDDKIKWKDSIKQVVGLERSTVKGLDL